MNDESNSVFKQIMIEIAKIQAALARAETNKAEWYEKCQNLIMEKHNLEKQISNKKMTIIFQNIIIIALLLTFFYFK